MEQYGIPEYGDVGEFLSHLALRKGKLRKGKCKLVLNEQQVRVGLSKGGIPDMAAAARSLLQDWNRYKHNQERSYRIHCVCRLLAFFC